MFQYKILNNILHLNKQLSIFNKKDTKLRSHCRLQDETTNHIFVECKFAIKLYIDSRHYCHCSFDLPILNPQSDTFGFFETNTFKPHTAIIQVLYLFVKRLFKAFICSPIEKY